MLSLLPKALLYLQDLVFPKACLGCRREGQWLCAACRERINIAAADNCPICKRPDPNGSVCAACSGQSALEGLWVVAKYDDRLVQDLIKALKYGYVSELKNDFGRLIEKYFISRTSNWENALLLPIPLHRRRLLERGFNQSELIAQAAGEVLGLAQSEPLLRRKRYSRAQAKLSRPKRIANIKNAFIFNQKFVQADKNVRLILVDDVYTTGATMQECAKVLRENGFNNIRGLVIARGK